ncbi:MAG: septum formation protein Maf [Alphaproteobacteria bacterium]|nr:septum formation protein Maf [Alphaproteobacteria bacterium]
MSLFLASGSPRRAQLCAQIGLSPQILADFAVDETPNPQELPRRYAERMALSKATAANEILDGGAVGDVLIAADTVVALGRRILPNTQDPECARVYLQQLSGRRHRVWGGLTVWYRLESGWQKRIRVSETRLKFARLSTPEISEYIASAEWMGCAGGYAIQGRAARFVAHIQGSYANVVGLDVTHLWCLLPKETRRDA